MIKTLLTLLALVTFFDDTALMTNQFSSREGMVRTLGA